MVMGLGSSQHNLY